MKFGYIRVSTKEQHIDRQLTAILKEQIGMNHIYIDKASGKDFNRENYQILIRKLKAGDELYIKSIDRLGRNYDEIIREWNVITKDIKAEIIVLDFPLLDTRAKPGDLTGRFLSDFYRISYCKYCLMLPRLKEKTHAKDSWKVSEKQRKRV